ncbi:MAG: SAM-dependent methyltransferase [Thiobacillaceae bacterium]
MAGTLYLIPVPLGPVDAEQCMPPATLTIARQLDTYIVERAKTARLHLKAIGHPAPLQTLNILELNEHTKAADVAALLGPLEDGKDVGLMSEAGCPAVADPGAELVRAAHQKGISVVPLVGPSSILLALMASGLGGQRFCFHGYLPAKEPARTKKIRELEASAKKGASSQLFIETPYRSSAMLEALVAVLSPDTYISVSADLTLPGQFVRTLPARNWKGESASVRDRLVVFGIGT